MAAVPTRAVESRRAAAPAGVAAPRGAGVFLARLLLVVLVAGFALAVWRAADVLLMAFGGVLLAVTLRALADLLARWTPLRPRLALPAAIAIILAVLAVLAWSVGETVASQFDQLLRQLPTALGKLRDWLAKTGLGGAVLGSVNSGDALESVRKLAGAAMMTLGAATNVLLMLILGIYLAADPGLYWRGLLRLLPAARRGTASAALSRAGAALRRWLVGQLVAMLLVGVLTGLGLAALGVPLALSLAIIAGVLEFVPFVGPILAAVPAVLIAFGQDAVTALYVAALYFGIQQLEGYLLMPLVQRWAVALPPALGALSVVVFAVLFGLPGALFAVPLTVVAVVLVDELLAERDLAAPE